MAQLIDPTSAAFLASETKNQPMHVGGLQLFEPPPDAEPTFLRDLYERAIRTTEIAPLFKKHPSPLLPRVGPMLWKVDDRIDMEYHLRHSALPQPGRIRELLELSSRLHGTIMTRERPMWEMTVIEGLADGRIALYSKIHHSLVDGVSAMKILQSFMSPDPDERDMLFPFDAAVGRRRRTPKPSDLVEPAAIVGALRSALAISADAAGMPGAVIKSLNRGARGQTSPISLSAPRTIFNVPVSASRRVAADSWPLERLRAVGRATGTTLNDVVLAMCGGALRAYLDDLGELPEDSLVSMVPVSLKSRSATSEGGGGGNAVGAIMTKLGTEIADPATRLTTINESMQAGKEALESMTPAQILAVTALGMAPAMALPMLKLAGLVKPPFNLVISNVPGPRETQYFNGAKMTDQYPLSIPMNGNAMNITCTSYADQMGFGITGCRRAVPHLQRLLVHLEDSLTGLEVAAGVA
ncbi:WS/DGAT/MGAT family O-acyltransferase [Nocardioides montaniterrae]